MNSRNLPKGSMPLPLLSREGSIMTLVRTILPFLAPVLLCTACAGGLATRTGQISIDRTFTHTGFRWAEGGLVHVYLTARPSEGKVEICAAWMYDGDGPSYTYRLNDDVLQSASVRIDGDRVLNGLGFAHELARTQVVEGKQANCARGGAPWKPDYGLYPVIMKVPRLRFID